MFARIHTSFTGVGKAAVGLVEAATPTNELQESPLTVAQHRDTLQLTLDESKRQLDATGVEAREMRANYEKAMKDLELTFPKLAALSPFSFTLLWTKQNIGKPLHHLYLNRSVILTSFGVFDFAIILFCSKNEKPQFFSLHFGKSGKTSVYGSVSFEKRVTD